MGNYATNKAREWADKAEEIALTSANINDASLDTAIQMANMWALVARIDASGSSEQNRQSQNRPVTYGSYPDGGARW